MSHKCPTVKWSGIQNALEEAQSDVVILLDCCAGGAANTLEGNGVTELIAACGYNAIANGVGQYSFTSALITELLDLSSRPAFTVAYLYNNIFSRIQGRMPEDGRERHPPPIHLVLTQEDDFPRSIQLSICSDFANQSVIQPTTVTQGKQPEGRETAASKPSSISDSHSGDDEPIQLEALVSAMPKVPRLAFAVRLKDSVKPNQLRTDLFLEWLRTMPTIAEEVKVEAGFGAFSSLVILSIPTALASFLPRNRAIISLGPISSSNQVVPQKSLGKMPRLIHSGRHTNRNEGVQTIIVPNRNSKRSRDGRPEPVYHIEEKLPERWPAERRLSPRDIPAPNLKEFMAQLPEGEQARAPQKPIRVATTNSPTSALVSGRQLPIPSTRTKMNQGGQFPPSPPSSYEGSPAPSHDEMSEDSEDVDGLTPVPLHSSNHRRSFVSALPSYLQKLSSRSRTGSKEN